MPKLTKNEENAIESLIDTFDFEKAHALFHTMGWTYFDGPPSVARLEQSGRELLEHAIEIANKNPNTNWVSSGRFRATYRVADNELELELIFDSKIVHIHGD